VGDKVEETFIISSIDGTPSTIKVTINGTNDKPTIAAQSHSVTEDGQLLQGQMAGTDIDDGAQLTYSVANPVDGLTLNKDGSYSFDPSNSTYQHLADKQTQTLTIPVTITDEHNSSSTENLTITITGTGDAAIIGGVDTGSVIEKTAGDNMSPDFAHSGMATLGNSVLYADGQLTIVDADKGEQGFASHTNAYNYHGTYGDLILNPDGSWHYVADAGSVSHIGGRPTTRGTAIDQLGKGDTLTDTITVHSIDGTTHDIVITINGSNDRPYCSSKVQLNSGKEDLAQTITATELLANTIDVDSNDLGKLTVANLHADHGSILDNQDGTYTFTPTKDYNGQVHFSYDVTDAHGGTTHTEASTTLTATPDSAIISEVTTDHVTEDGAHSSHNAGVTTELANGRLQVVDPDSGENKFQYSQFGESAVHDPFGGMLRIDSMGNWGYSVNNANLQHLAQGQTETVVYRVHSYDGTAYELHIDVVGTNDAPTVTQVALSNGTEDTHYQMQASQFGFTDVDTGDTLHSIAITDIPPATQGKFVLDGHDITAGQHIPTADISKLQFVPAQNFNGDVQFKYTVNDGHTDSTEATNTLHFDAVGDVAVITGTTTGDVDEGHGSFGNMSPDYAQPGMAKLGQSALTADGKLDIVDPDTGESQFDSKGGAWNNSYHGQYGHLLLNTDGTWHYDVTVGNVDWVGNRKTTVGTTIDELGENQTLTDTITIYSKDGTAHDIVITIHGDNDRPYISSEVTLATGTEDTAQTLTTADLLTNTVDVDANDVGKLSIENLVSDHGSLLDNKDGTFTFTPEKDYNGTVHFSYDVKDAHGGVTHTGATTTLVAVQDNAIISGVDTGSVTENTAGKDMSPDHAQPGMSHLTGAMLYADGKLSISDPDAGENEFDTNQVGSQGYTYHGSYGQLILNADGSWHYNVNAGSQNNGVMPGTVGAAIDKLGDGESLTDTITIRAKDGTTHDIVITIHGSNDRPYCSSEVQLHSGKEDTAQTLTTADLLANTVDVDANDASQLSIANLVSDHGVVIDNKDGTFTFNPDKDYNGQVHFTYDVKDAHGGITHTGATTTLAAVNDAAVFSVDDTGSVKEDVHVQGDAQHTVAVSGVLLVSDPDAGESEFVANRNVHAVSDPFGGDLSIGRAGDWTYSVPNNNLNRLAEGEKHKVTYEVVSRGGDKHQIVITVIGTNDDPQLSVTQTTPTTGTLTETDVDVKDMHTFSVVSSTGQFGSLSVDPDTGAYVYTANSSVAGMTYNSATHTYHGADVFEVKVADNHGGESSRFLTFDTNGHVTVISGQQPSITTTVPQNPAITKTQPSLPTGSNTPPSNAVTVDLAASSDSGKSNTDNLTNNTTPTIMGHTDIPYSQVTVYDGSTPIGHAVSDSSGQYSIAVSSLSNGDHNLSAKALAPSSALPATSSLLSVHVDTTIAPLTIGLTHDTGSSTSDLITSDGALTITGQEAGATVEYSADNGQTWVSSFTPQQGSNTVSVRQTDAAGNVSASTSLTFTLDDQIAAPSIDLKSSTDSGSSSTDDLTNIHTPIITGSAEANSIISITDETGKVVATGTTNSNGIYQLTTSDIAEGKHTLTVSTTDVAGNQNSATLPIEVDYTAPTISKVNLKTETTHQPTFSGTVSLDTTSVDIVIKSGSTIVETLHATLDGKGGYTVDATNLPDRTYTAYIQATDKAGNTTASGYAGTFDRFTVDTHAAAPTISFESTGADNIYNAAEIASGAANTITSTIHLPSDVNPKDTLTINGHPHLITNAEYLAQSVNVEVAPGASISASITDDNGNTSIVTNATAPNADTNVATLQVSLTHDTGSDTSDLITNDGALTITGEEAGATVEYSTDNGHTWTSSFTPQQGANTVSVRQTDVAGNVSSPSSLSFTLDNVIAAPAVSLTVDSGDSHSDKLSNLGMLKVTGETGAEIEYSTDGGTSWTTSFNPTHQGQNSILVRQTDTAGNSASTTFSFDYDTSKPIFTIVDPGVQSKAIVQLSGTASTDTTSMTVDIVSTGQNQTIATLHPSVDVNGHWSIDTSALGDGDYTIGVYGKDAAGNSSPQFHGRVTGHLLVDTSVSVTDDNNIAVEDSTQRVAGNVLSNDVDANLVITTGDIQGTYGIFHLTADGSYTYALNNQLSVIQQLDSTSPPLVDSIAYTASDNHGNQATAHLAISIQGTDDNLTPTVTGQTVSTNEDTTRTFVTSEFGYSDQDGDALRFVTISSIPSHGLLLLNGNAVTTNQQISKADLDAGHLTFTPISNENGVDYAQFTFTANDGHQNSASATMKLNVNAVNDAATFTGDSGSIREDTNIHHNVHTTGSATIPDALVCKGHLVISDVDGQGEAALDLNGQQFVSQDGTYGHFVIKANGSWLYTANNNNSTPIQDLDKGQTLTDSIEITSKDGTKHSITVTINGTTDDPVLHSLSDSGVQHSGPIEGNLLTGSGTDQGLSGAATDTDSNAHLVLQDIQIKDPVSGYVAVRPGQPHTMTGIGTLAIEANGHYTFTPEAGFTGKVPSMVYRVGDDGGNPIGDSSQNSLSIEVTPPLQHTPTVTGQTVSTNEDITRTITTSEFGYSDQDGDALQFVTISSIPSHGSLLLNGNAVITNQQISKADLDAGHLTFTPINNENGANYAQFSFTANDGHQNSASATMIVDVNAVNDAPIVGSSFISSLEDKPHTFTTADFKYSDIDGDALNHITVTNVTHGVLTLNGTTVNVGDDVSASDVSSLIFTPTHNYFSSGVSGLGAVQFTANDGQVDSKEGSIFINIANVADPATFGGDSTGVAQEDTTLQASGTLTSSDPDGTAGFIAVQGGAGIAGSKGYGHAHIDANGHWTYDLYNKHPIVQQLAQGQTVTETITVQSLDGTHHDIVVTITGTNDLPTVSEKPQAGYVVGQHSLDEDSGLNPAGQLIINDVDGDTTTVALDPAHSAAYGHVVFDSHSGTWVYHLDNNNPTVNALNDNDTLQDKFTLLVDDGHGQKVPQEITMTINGHTDAVPHATLLNPPRISGGAGHQDLHATLGIPPLMHQGTPSLLTGWGISDGHGHSLSHLQGQFGALNVNPATGELHYDYAPSSGVIKTHSGGNYGGTDETDTFVLTLGGSQNSHIEVHLHLHSQSVHGNSGHHIDQTTLIGMDVSPISTAHPAPPPPPPVQHDEPDMASQADFTVTQSDDSYLDLTQHTHQEPDQKTSHHGAAAYLDALGIKPDATSTTVHDQPADMDIVLAQVDHQDATTHDQAHLDMSDALEHHDANINHNQDDEHHHHDIDGLPDIDPNS
ncbi:hypothetical protein A143_21460, partial [Vibrio splendidus ZS-139]